MSGVAGTLACSRAGCSSDPAPLLPRPAQLLGEKPTSVESGCRREGEDASSSVSGDTIPERLPCKPSLPSRIVRSCAVRGDAITRFAPTNGDEDGLEDE